MKLCDKLRTLRKQHAMTQSEAAEAIGVSLRTYKCYELDQTTPRYRKTFQKLADLYHVNINYLLQDDSEFPLSSDARDEAHNLILQAQALFAGGQLSKQDKDAVFLALTDAYHHSKDRGE